MKNKEFEIWLIVIISLISPLDKIGNDFLPSFRALTLHYRLRKNQPVQGPH